METSLVLPDISSGALHKRISCKGYAPLYPFQELLNDNAWLVDG